MVASVSLVDQNNLHEFQVFKLTCNQISRYGKLSSSQASRKLGPRREIITQDCAEFWFVYKAHPPAHIGICVGGCNAVDGPKNNQDVSLFLAAALRLKTLMGL